MPELPEVETICQQLHAIIPLEIDQVDYSTHQQSIVKQAMFSLEKQEIVAIQRHGKVLIAVFRFGHRLVSRLGMSGSWRISDVPVTEKHTHIQMKGRHKNKVVYLAYIDPRRFGKIYFLDEPAFLEFFQNLGLDITAPSFTSQYIYDVFQRYPQRILKPFLLEQKYFAGIGNYIASEVCAHARLKPDRMVGKLTRNDCQRIKTAVKKVLSQAVKSGGTTFQGAYKDTSGDKGSGVKNLVVFYQTTCQLCKKNPVKKTVLNGRGTYHCPICQL